MKMNNNILYELPLLIQDDTNHDTPRSGYRVGVDRVALGIL